MPVQSPGPEEPLSEAPGESEEGTWRTLATETLDNALAAGARGRARAQGRSAENGGRGQRARGTILMGLMA